LDVVARDLHAATEAALRHLRPSALREALEDATDAYATYVQSRWGDAASDVPLAAYREAVEERARELAEALRSTPYAERLRGLSEGESRREASSRAAGIDWAALSRPFAASDVQLAELEVDPATGAGIARPVVDAEALRARLDAAAGPGRWSLRFDSAVGAAATGPVVKAALQVGPATREAFGEAREGPVARAHAFRRAARLFGIARGLDGTAVVSVQTDASGAVTNRSAILRELEDAGAVARGPDA
jgi:hypothetical protein